ncbi:MAG: hypothetical protein QW366_02125 [Sulfolobales archaeon]
MVLGIPVITMSISSHIHLNLPIYYAYARDEIAQKMLFILCISENEYKLKRIRIEGLKYEENFKRVQRKIGRIVFKPATC